jgi:hypothetical protein
MKKSKRIDQIARAAGARTQTQKKETIKRAINATIKDAQRAYDRSRVRELPNNLKPHPLAEAFPPLSKEEFAGLVEDIRANGQQIPIILLDGKILDGVHRYKACRKVGIKARGEHYSGSNAAAFVCSANVHRRHLKLTNKQKHVLIAKVLKASPEISNRQVASVTKTHHETVAAERTALETRGEIATLGAESSPRPSPIGATSQRRSISAGRARCSWTR